MYCSIDDVKLALKLLGEEPGEDEAIEEAARLAANLIDSYTGRHFRAEPVTESHEPIEGQVLLNHWPLVELVEAKDKDGEPVEWEEIDPRIGLIRVFTSERVWITYYYNDPQNPVPEDVKRLAARLAAKLLTLPPEELGRVSAGEVSLELKGLLGSEARWVLLKYRHLPRFL